MAEVKSQSANQAIEKREPNSHTSHREVLRASLLGLCAFAGTGLSLATASALTVADRDLALRLAMLFHVLPAQPSGQPGVAEVPIAIAHGAVGEGAFSISSISFVLVVVIVST